MRQLRRSHVARMCLTAEHLFVSSQLLCKIESFMGTLTEFKRSKLVGIYLGLFLTPGRLCAAGDSALGWNLVAQNLLPALRKSHGENM